jgi:hypothetical protein
MPKKKIVPAEVPNPAVIGADETNAEVKPRKAGARASSSADRTNKRKSAGAAGKLAVESSAQQANEAILGASVSEEEQVALLAYSYWEARGRQGGSAEEDWLRAVREIRNRGNHASKIQPN